MNFEDLSKIHLGRKSQNSRNSTYLWFERLGRNVSLQKPVLFIFLIKVSASFSPKFLQSSAKLIFPQGKTTSNFDDQTADVHRIIGSLSPFGNPWAWPLPLRLNVFQRNSKIAMNEWRTKIDKELFDRVQLDCETMMKDFGYKHYQTVEDLKKDLDEPYFTSW